MVREEYETLTVRLRAGVAFVAIDHPPLDLLDGPLIAAGGDGTQHLPRLVGRSRALEIILGSDLVDAETAQRYGLVNRTLPADELDGFVERLAPRIASSPWLAVAAAKQAVEAAALPSTPGPASRARTRSLQAPSRPKRVL
ncbi:enoyl-CoA hydratase/isomerase family protein [Frankia sp. Ag45/Mut15]|uniref:Enoyl-CoA hydratase/isomerase family protein n=1 Tax=Frankia umida TaxID=573489 RepID=A0ABT0K4I1_9ACTN|nr:enoyl-CoA hydratase/isomerase family protein [Frankia umida]MCK9878701.1 enoyl-CoA hydratase/isomerase family protein [Frankia umida]